MLYRCKTCDYEEARGCLPSVSCGLYLVFLLGIANACHSLALLWLRSLIGESSAASDEPVPWWIAVGISLIVIPTMLVVWVLAAIALKYLLELIEYLTFAWRKCPTCGQRRWSWGYTRGFGL
jgi:hypothetical protein